MNIKTKIRLSCAIAAAATAFTATDAGAQTVAVKTDAIYWASATPNAGIEVRVAPKWTVGLTAGYNPFTFSDNSKFKHVLVRPEARRWLCAGYAGHFIGGQFLYSHYNIGNIDLPFGLWPSLDERRYQGDLGAVGISYGYSWMLGRHWSLEGEIGVGVGVTRYREYLCEVCGTQVDTGTRWLVMPTKLSLSVVYYIR